MASNKIIREKRTTIRQSTSLSPPCLFESYKRLNGRFNVLLNWWKSLLYFIGWSNLQDFPSFRNLHSKQETIEAHISLLWQQSTNEILWWHSNFDFVPFVIPLLDWDHRQRRHDGLPFLVDCFPTLIGWLYWLDFSSLIFPAFCSIISVIDRSEIHSLFIVASIHQKWNITILHLFNSASGPILAPMASNILKSRMVSDKLNRSVSSNNCYNVPKTRCLPLQLICFVKSVCFASVAFESTYIGTC